MHVVARSGSARRSRAERDEAIWCAYVPLILLLLCACAPAPRTTLVTNNQVTATLAAQSSLRFPGEITALSLDAFGNLFVLDRAHAALIEYSKTGDSLRSISGLGRDHYNFDLPTGVDARLTNSIFVADFANHRIESYTRALAYDVTLYAREDADAAHRFGFPRGVAADDAGDIYLIDGENKRVLKFRSDFTFERVIGGFSEATRSFGVLSNPTHLCVDGGQHLIVLDRDGHALMSYDLFGNALAEIPLEESVVSICTTGDSLLALASSGKDVRLYDTRTLAQVGRWHTPSDSIAYRTIASRAGAFYLAGTSAIRRCVPIPNP